MTTADKSRKELLDENESLRLRLEETEDTLRAIGSGEVDAFVVSGPDGEQVYTLKGAELPYRILVETMNEGAATLASDSTILYCNNRLASMLEIPLEKLTGTRLDTYMAPADLPLFMARLGKCTQDCDTDEITVTTVTGDYVPVLISCSAHELDGNRRISIVVTDLRQKKRNDAIVASERLARSIIEQAGEAILVCDEKGRIIRASQVAHDLCGKNPLLRFFDELFPLRIVDTGGVFSVTAPFQGSTFENIEVEFQRGAGQVFNLLLNAGRLTCAENRISGSVVTLADITERKRTEVALRESEVRLKSSLQQLQAANEKYQVLNEELQLQGDELQVQNRELTRLWEKSQRDEAALRDSEDQLRLAQINADVGIWDWEPSTGRLVWTPELQALFGLAPGTIKSYEDWRARVHPDDIARIEAERDAAIANQQSFDLEFRILHSSGQVRWLASKGKGNYSLTGELLRASGVNIDITARKEAEGALRESEARLTLALEGGHMGLWEWDTHSDRSVWNATEYKLLGLPVGEGTEATHRFFDRVHPEDAVTFNRILADVMQNGNDFHHEFRITRADDGQERWLAAVGRLFRDAAGQPLKMLGVNYDITSQKQAEAGLKKWNEELEIRVAERTAELAASIEKLKVETAERMQVVEALRDKEQMLIHQSRQAAMGEMIGNIAHQWRQPLNLLGLSIQQLKLYYDLGEFTKEFLDKSVVASMDLIEHMSKTIDDFRNYFRPDKEKCEFKVSEAIQNTLSLIEDSFKNKNIEVEVIGKGDPVIYGYRNEFAQVLLNILSNASDVLTERQTMDPKVTITFGSEGEHSVVTVADNAGGIPEEIIGKIFDPYFTTKGPQQGTGVGLYMSKTIIEKNMGGELAVRNVADGAEFRIEV